MTELSVADMRRDYLRFGSVMVIWQGKGHLDGCENCAAIEPPRSCDQDALARAVFKAAVHHSRSSISIPAGASSSASPASTSPPW